MGKHSYPPDQRRDHPPDHRRDPRRDHPRDRGHEAVGQALLISIGLAGMIAANRLAEVSVAGITVVMNALR